jgi:hypothetical protein
LNYTPHSCACLLLLLLLLLQVAHCQKVILKASQRGTAAASSTNQAPAPAQVLLQLSGMFAHTPSVGSQQG